ncbi:MAG: hypothetical protein Q7T76_04980 [Ferruginibacter sp.]|nr:hypothetical protein [Ferruginibacter sp.]
MANTTTLMGKVTFINHEKGYATIEYAANGRTKTVNGNISLKEQEKLKAEKIIKKLHHFHVGDEVSFVLAQSPRGDRMIADCIEYKFNNALDNLLTKSTIDNRLVGYLKKVEEDYFVKETGSYIFFPLELSPWERRPSDTGLNEPVFFKITNKGKQGKATAELFKSDYIPEFLTAKKYYNNKTVIQAEITKVSAHAIFVNVVGEKVKAKLPMSNDAPPVERTWNTGDKILLRITYLSPHKIVVEEVTSG